MKKKWFKMVSAVLIAAVMLLSVFPGTNQTVSTVYAAENEAPTADYWIAAKSVDGAAGLDTGYNLNGGTIAKIKFGAANRLWAICGKDGNDLALLSTTAFGTAAYGSSSNYSTSNFVTGMATYLGTSYFSTSELDKMQLVTVSTNEPDFSGGNINTPVTDKKLYLPNSADQNSSGATIYAGSGNTIAIDLSKLTSANGFQTNFFWLRSPYKNIDYYALMAFPGDTVGYARVTLTSFISVVPAFHLNLSSVIFASAAEAASSSYIGDKANITMTANTYTMRYAPDNSWDSISAVISADGTSVKVTNANGKYLMVQNSNGVYALSIDSTDAAVNATNVTIVGETLSNFNNCKIWVESTTDRITTAKLATQATIADVAITDITAPTVGSAFDTSAACATTGVTEATPAVTWTPSATTAGYNTDYTASVTVTAAEGYQFRDSTTATINGNTASSVTKNSDGTLTVTYEFPITAKDKLTSITAPTAITVANGTAYSAMNLPTTVGIVTEGTTVTTATVNWDTTTPASGSYDASVLTEQTVILNGTVACPSNIDQNSVPLSTTIQITISAAGIVGAPSFDPVGTTYTENKTVTLTSSTEGATIYYTTDGTNPTTESSVYSAPISVTGVAGESNVSTIKAIATKSGMQTSSASSATYTIEIPAVPENYTITYNANGGSGTMESETATEGVPFTLKANGFTAPSGKQFKCWALGSAAGTQVNDGSTHTFTGATTVYAVWDDIPAPTTYAVTVSNGSGDGSYVKDATVTITADTAPSGQHFKEWTVVSGGVTLTSATSASTTFTMPANTVEVTATYENDTTPVPASGGSSTGSTSSKTETIKVDIKNGDTENTISQITIERTTDSTGQKTDNITYDTTKAKETVQELQQNGDDTARIYVTDNADKVAETKVNIPSTSIGTLADGAINLQIDTEVAKIDLSQNTLTKIEQGSDDDLYFRLVPVKDATQKETAVNNALIQVVKVTGNSDNTATIIGNPITIETNMSSMEADITLPLTGLTIPTDPTEHAAFLQQLAVYIEHSDGSKELVQGELVAYRDGTYGIKFHITKFSTFTIVKTNAFQKSTTVTKVEKGFAPLQLKAEGKKTSQKLTYTKVSGADGYIIYGNSCGMDNHLIKLVDVASNTTCYKVTGLKEDTYYKYQVKAYRLINGKKVVIAKSLVIHTTTESSKNGNPTKVNSDVSAVSLKTGMSKQLKCSLVLPKDKKMKKHIALISFESSNTNIATVNNTGRIVAVGKGTCYVYAYAQNGIYKKIKITVK